MSSMRYTALGARIVTMLALCLALAARASAAPPPLGPDVWSMQLDGGLFAPLQATGASPTAGMRYCKHIGTHLQSGLRTGWTFKRAKLESNGEPDAGTHVELARVDANLVPVMAFMQVDLTDRFLVPFFGFGVGYEWLTLHAIVPDQLVRGALLPTFWEGASAVTGTKRGHCFVEVTYR